MEVMPGPSSGGSGGERTLRPGLGALSAGDCASFGRPTLDSGVNTDDDWEEQVRTMLEAGSRLSQDFNALKLMQQQDELDFNKSRSELQKKRDQAVKQHQALLEKMASVRVKLQLNNSKATRKNFLSKIQEMTSEKSRAQEEKDRLREQLSEVEVRLSSLEQEQEDERRQWDLDLADLRRQTERAQNEARDADAKAEKDMRTALERHRDTGNEMVTAWLNQVGVYLGGLRAELPHRHRQERAHWERREAAVRKDQAELQKRISELLLRLDRHELDSVPTISLPALPQVPMAELYFHRIMQVTPRPPAPPPVLAPPPAIVNPRGAVLLPAPLPRHAHFAPPPQTRHPPPFPRQHFYPPVVAHPPAPPPAPAPAPARHHAPQTPPPPPQSPPIPATTANPANDATTAPPPPPPPAAAAAGKLDKVLEKLGAHFPGCSRAQLTWFLQQVKSERGTLAGLSLEEVVEQIRQKAEAAASGPREAAASAQAAPAPAPRKPCLMCQKPVDPRAKFELKCAHTVHTDCIQVWLQSSKSNSCPFCPNK